MKAVTEPYPMGGTSSSGLLLHLIGLLLACTAFAAMAGGELKTFEADSLAEITRERAEQPFILMLWSLDCPSCMKELAALSVSIKQHPDLKLVMISTDDQSMADDVAALLTKFGLGSVELWIFGGADAQRLRHAIDPTWYGELPRSYFYDAAHQRRSHVGVLKAEDLDAWVVEIGAK